MPQGHSNNTGKHLHTLISEVGCGPHQVPSGIPCYLVPTNQPGGFEYFAACGSRIKKAGFIGKISPQSMRTKAPGKPNDRKSNSRPTSFTGKN